MNQLGKDMRFGLRMIRKSPGFAAAAILTLALGIGGTTAIFSFVDAVLRKPLPFPGADQILNVWEKPPGGERNGISTLNFLDWKNQNTVFTAMPLSPGAALRSLTPMCPWNSEMAVPPRPTSKFLASSLCLAEHSPQMKISSERIKL